MRTSTREPQTLAGEGTLDRMARILAARNIDPAAVAALADEPESFSPLDALTVGIPPRYQDAMADHPQVVAWTREVAERAVAPGRGARRQVATGPSLLMAGVVGSGKTHQAYGAVRSLVQSGVGVRWRATTAADLLAELRPAPGATASGSWRPSAGARC